MKVQVLFLLVVTVSYVRAEPPAELSDEPLEGERLDPELLSKVRELLISDISGSGNSPVSRATPSSYAPPSNSYGAPNIGSQSFAPPPAKFGVSGSSQSQRGSGGDITIADPELAPLISTFELSPTVQKRRNAPNRESNTGFGNGAGNFGKQTSGGY